MQKVKSKVCSFVQGGKVFDILKFLGAKAPLQLVRLSNWVIKNFQNSTIVIELQDDL